MCRKTADEQTFVICNKDNFLGATRASFMGPSFPFRLAISLTPLVKHAHGYKCCFLWKHFFFPPFHPSLFYFRTLLFYMQDNSFSRRNVFYREGRKETCDMG